MSCRTCETITQPPMPSLPIERGLPGPGLLAHVLVSKYCDHLPLYRQSGIYARDGVEIDRSTMAEWVGRMAFLLEPLAAVDRAACARRRQSSMPTTRRCRCLIPDEARQRPDDYGWRSGTSARGALGVPPAVFYRYAPDRRAEQAEALLKDCRGFLHADAYSGFNTCMRPTPITGSRASDRSRHAGRTRGERSTKFMSPRLRRRLMSLLEQIGELFAIEDDIRGRAPEGRLAVRADRAVPLLRR